MATLKVGIIGDGNVGSALRQGIEKKPGYDVRAVGRDRRVVGETAKWADLIILAIPFPAVDDALKSIGAAADGKALVDATNALDGKGGLAVGFTTSAAEELQKKAPRAKVVKAFNTVFSKNMSTGKIKGEAISALVAADDAQAKRQVLDLAKAIGFEPVDAGPLQNARWLEAMALLIINLGYAAPKYGLDIGYKLVGAAAK
ncbi:MAG TPA: hypothetical protein VLU99_01315 [Nitrososphaerales archaeon]|nr:hypothetical protein [Nitrososphaerales archaeon]HUK74401.1 hypothetical protein [Nitrososphaerales archaeon]